MAEPLVSILISFFNSGIHIKHALESALGQTYSNIEILLVNDGSTDESYNVIQEYLSDTRIRYFEQANSGQSAATNFALSKANGEYIQFLDADDSIHGKKIEHQINFILKNQLSYKNILTASYGDMSDIFAKDVLVVESKFYYIEDPTECIYYTFKNFTLPNNSFLISKKLIFETGLYNESLTLDNNYEFFTKIILASQKIYCISQAVVFNRFVNNSLSRRKDRKSVQSSIRARIKAANYLKDHSKDLKKTKEAIVNLILQFLLMHSEVDPLSTREAKIYLKSIGYKDIPPRFLTGKMKVLAMLIGTYNAIAIKKAFF